jgi:MFS family permease
MLLAVSLIGAVAFLGNPIFQLIPVFADDVFHVEAGSFGLLAGALGCGGVIGAVVLGSLGNVRQRGRLVRYALFFYAAAVVSFGVAPGLAFGIAALAAAGAGFLMVVASLSTSVQLLVPEALRGRVMALYIMTFTGSYPIGSLVQGALADVIGPRTTVVGAGCVLGLVALVVGTRPMLLEALDEQPGCGLDSTVGSTAALQSPVTDDVVVEANLTTL